MNLLATLFTALLAAFSGVVGPSPARDEVQVMTFNIRYGTAQDGQNAWDRRKTIVADLIGEKAPDVLAIQEGLAFQLEDLAPALEEYEKLGQHRDGGTEGEFSGLYVNTDRLRVIRWGEFWLSLQPESVASVGWDAALPRMAVWADLEPVDGGARFRVYGTHFDHRGEEARLESARLIASHAEGGPPAIVMGDLNSAETAPPVRVFFDLGYHSAFRTLHPQSVLGTFNGFQDPTGGDRIDHILLGPGITPLQAEILDVQIDGVWPSDHFPVTALVRILPQPSAAREG